MKWLLVIATVLIAVVLLVVIVGSLLPRDHVAIVSARVAGAPDAVWQAITDVANQPSWRSDVKRVEVLPSNDGKTTWREHSSNGAILMVIDAAQAPSHLVTRIADDKLPFGGTWDYVIAPSDGGGSVVTITERGSVYNPLFRFMSRYVFGHTATMDAYLRSLGRKFGSDVTPAIVAAQPSTSN
ncbi:MAG TPA: SRPBCC family protein [Gemmatimonadaceae bacterium]|jgi:uncharacterized protein YndB with AHSA1/START domain